MTKVQELIDKANRSLNDIRYWTEDESDHVCDRDTPIGACLKCDLLRMEEITKELRNYLEEHERRT